MAETAICWCGQKIDPHVKKSRKTTQPTECAEHRYKCNQRAASAYQKNKKTKKYQIKLSTQRARIRAMKLLGGLVCKGCGETDYVVLTIDHIDGREPGEGRNRNGLYYDILAERVDRKRFRILCHNCQYRNEIRRGNRAVFPEIEPDVIAAGGRYHVLKL